MTFETDQPAQTLGPEVVEPRHEYVGEPPSSRDAWYWVQLMGLGMLAAGVAILVVFALALGGR